MVGVVGAQFQVPNEPTIRVVDVMVAADTIQSLRVQLQDKDDEMHSLYEDVG